MATSQRSIAAAMITIILGILTVLGLYVLQYNRQLRRFEYSKLLTSYAVLIASVLSVIYTHEIIDSFLNQRLNLNNAVQHFYYMNIIMLIINYIAAFIQTRATYEFITTSTFFELLDYFEIPREVVRSSVALIGVKTILFPIVGECALILKQIYDEPEKNLLWTLYTLGPVVISSVVPNCFFGAVIICRQFTKALNARLELVVKEVNALQRVEQMELHKSYYRMQRFCDLADIIDILAGKYVSICKQSMAYTKVVAFAFMCSLLGNLVSITAGCFMQYYDIAEALINENAYDGINSLTNFVHLIIASMEIVMQSYMCHTAIEEVRLTGLTLQRINLMHADERFRQAVEAFSLKTFSTDFKIQPLGLLEINVSLVHDVFAAVTSFLLILIQTDLSLRFSLK